MNAEEFIRVVEAQFEKCEWTLTFKANEYATDDDRLHNFKVAAALQSISTKQALAGMMAKHSTSIYDMCKSNTNFTEPLWIEKITDHINYLFLLRAIVAEDAQKEHEELAPWGEKTESPKGSFNA